MFCYNVLPVSFCMFSGSITYSLPGVGTARSDGMNSCGASQSSLSMTFCMPTRADSMPGLVGDTTGWGTASTALQVC